MRTLIFDPFAGISGDMTVGALLDLGLSGDWLQSYVAQLGLGDIGVTVEGVKRRGIAATLVRFDAPPEQPHRHLRHVLEIVDRSRASETARQRAAEAFRLIARAEAEVHGTTIEAVHFHEVGALDAILDVLCTMAAVEEMGFEAFLTRTVAIGHGWIDIEHGRYPIPAPATLKILEGIPVGGQELEGECTTPTGAAILVTLTGGRSPGEALVPERSGFGAGSRDPEDRPNCLRLIAAETQPDAGQQLFLIQTDVDDLPPEYAPPAQDALFAAGALDAVCLPIMMKKGRPGLRLEALVPEATLHEALASLFKATPTLGVRYWPVRRPALPRREETMEWQGQSIRVKRVTLPDGTERMKPEYEDVARAAQALGIAPYELRMRLESGPAPTTDVGV